jgi:hypothetical protein
MIPPRPSRRSGTGDGALVAVGCLALVWYGLLFVLVVAAIRYLWSVS